MEAFAKLEPDLDFIPEDWSKYKNVKGKLALVVPSLLFVLEDNGVSGLAQAHFAGPRKT